jgi:hypothetical protein
LVFARLNRLSFFKKIAPIEFNPIFFVPTIGIEVVSLFTWLTYPLFSTEIFGTEWWKIARLESEMFYAFGNLGPVLLILLIATFTRYFFPTVISFSRSGLFQTISRIFTISDEKEPSIFKGKFLLPLAIIISATAIFFPYIESINPIEKPISSDIPIYEELLSLLDEKGNSPSEIIESAFTSVAGGDRPLSLLILYGLEKSIPLKVQTILKFLPLLLGPLLVIVVYYFVKLHYPKYSHISAVFTIFSYQFIGGTYAGFYANWFALIIFYLVMLLAVQYLKNLSKFSYLALTTASVLMLFTHIYTWGAMIGTLVFFLILLGIDAKKSKNKMLLKGCIMIALVIAVNISVDVARIYFVNVKGGLVKDIELLEELGGWNEYFIRWNNLQLLFSVYLGGSFINSAMLIFAIYASVIISKKSHFAKMLLASVYAAIIPTLFGNYDLQVRIIFNLPLHILGAIGFVEMIQKIHTRYGKYYSSSIFLLVFLHFGNYVLRNLANLFPKIPQS